MKTLLVTALVLVPWYAMAEDAETNAPAPNPAPAVADPLAGLTPDQRKQAESILEQEAKQKKIIEENKSLAPMQKEVQLSNLHRSTLIQIQAMKMSSPAPAKP